MLNLTVGRVTVDADNTDKKPRKRSTPMNKRTSIRSPQPVKCFMPATGNFVIIAKVNDKTVERILKLLRDENKTTGLYKQ